MRCPRKTRSPRPRPAAIAAPALVLALLGCGGEPAADYAAVPRGFPLPDPPSPVADMELAESYTVEVEDRLFVLGRDMVGGDLAAIGEALSSDFEGDSLAGLEVAEEKEQPLDARLVRYDASTAARTDAAGFAAGIEEIFGGWSALEWVAWEILIAEFQPARPPWGKIAVELHALGRDGGDRVRSVTARFDAQVVKDRGDWKLRALDLQSLESQSRGRTLFTDASDEAGIEYTGVPRGQGDPFSFQRVRQPFNGASSADVNGDGLWDLFVSGKERNFLYLNRGDGGFEEASVEWGLLKPGDGAGSVFFDFDNDGDQDLFVAGEGHVADDGSAKGNRLRLYRHDGDHYTEVGEELGVAEHMLSQSVIVLDYDNDGWLDLYVCNYGLLAAERNNSWADGNNGQPDALFRNVRGERFENVAAEAGVDFPRWSFAAGAADYDRDGDQDIYVAHDYAVNAFYRNRGDGTFEDVSAELTAEDLGFGMGVNWADLNNDGRLDIYVANMYVPEAKRIMRRLNPGAGGMDGPMKLSRGNTILIQGEDGRFRAAPEEMGGIKGLWAWGCATNDFDLDGRLDVFCTNGFFTRPGVGDIHSYFWRHVIATTVDVNEEPMIGMAEEPNSPAFRGGMAQRGKAGRSWGGHERDKLWFNRGEEGFVDLSDVSGADSPGDGRAAVALDFDDDGDVDLFLNEWSYDERNRQLLLRNDIEPQPSGFLKVQLRATSSHPQAVGAEVLVATPEGPCSQILAFGSGFVSANPPELIFGLGEAESARVEVLWPGAVRESFGEIAADSRVLLVEGSGEPAALPGSRAAE